MNIYLYFAGMYIIYILLKHFSAQTWYIFRDLECPNVVWILNTKQVKMFKRAAPKKISQKNKTKFIVKQ